MLLLPLAGLALGVLVLTVASDHFVLGAARLAVRFRLSAVVIGAVVIGFGTSAPEMLVSGLAAAQGSLDIAVGNIVGSNVANLSLVLGLAAMVTPIAVASPTIRREAPLSLVSVVAFAILVQGGLVPWEAAVLGVGLVAALWIILRSSRDGDTVMAAEVEEYLGDDEELPPAGREVVRTLLGLVGTVAGAQILIVAALEIAAAAGLREGFVGVTIVAIGTSLPELAAALQAARRDETDMIVGNLLGSNLFNSFGVGAVAGFAGPGPVGDPILTGTGVTLMVVIALLATIAMRVNHRVNRWEGLGLLLGYVVIIPVLG